MEEVKTVTEKGSPGEQPRKHCSRADKKAIVARIEAGELTIEQVVAKYKLSTSRIVHRWITAYGSAESLAPVYKRCSQGHRMSVALQIRAGLLSVEDAARQNSVQAETILKWIEKLDTTPGGVKPASSSNQMHATKFKGTTNAQQHPELENLRLKVAALETMIDLAEEHFKIDIRKKCGTKQQ
jgi:transposase-like protein